MVKHYFKVTFRHARKHLLITILNMSGLAIGIACFVLIMLYVNHELNYDRHNEHFSDIFTLKFLEGSPGKVLNEPGRYYISLQPWPFLSLAWVFSVWLPLLQSEEPKRLV